MKGNGNSVITLPEMAKAIFYEKKKRFPVFDNMEECRNEAWDMLSYFGYGEHIVDNVLDPASRSLVRQMEDWEFVKTRQTETPAFFARNVLSNWRSFYWFLNNEKIRESARNYDSVITIKPEKEYGIYDNKVMWNDIKEERESGKSYTSNRPGLPGSAAPALDKSSGDLAALSASKTSTGQPKTFS